MKRTAQIKYTISMAKDGIIYDKLKEVIDFLALADVVPEHFCDFGSIFQHHDAAMRTLALYWVLRAKNELKCDLRSAAAKRTYAEIIEGNRYCIETNGAHYFVRPVQTDDPVCGQSLFYLHFGKYEKIIPTLDAYLKKLRTPPCAPTEKYDILPASSTNGSRKPPGD